MEMSHRRSHVELSTGSSPLVGRLPLALRFIGSDARARAPQRSGRCGEAVLGKDETDCGNRTDTAFFARWTRPSSCVTGDILYVWR